MALLWIATKLLVNDNNGNETATSPSRNLLDAVKAIAVADVVMSLDNVIAVVAAADGNFALIVFGLGMSIPVIVAGATIIMAVLNRVPAIAWAGAAMLGWIAGDVIATDAAVVEYASTLGSAVHEHIRFTCSIAGRARNAARRRAVAGKAGARGRERAISRALKLSPDADTSRVLRAACEQLPQASDR